MAQLFRNGCIFVLAVLAGLLTLIQIPTAAFATPASNPDRAKLDDFSSISCQVSSEQLFPSRTVMQVINSQFYKWHEYENPLTGAMAIYLLEPKDSALCSDRAFELLQLSGQWTYESYLHQSTRVDKTAESRIISAEEAALKTAGKNIESLKEATIFTGLMTDDRTAVSISDAEKYPYNTIGFLTTDFPYEFMRGTGFLVSPHMALTNAHNIYSPQFGGWYKTIRFTPAQYENNNLDIITPYADYNPDKTAINNTFKDYEDRGKRDNAINHDYGAIFFEKPIANINTFMPLEFNHIPEEISLLGYPGNVRGELTLGMWLSEGPVLKNDDHCLYYEAYTSGGNSGSPVFVFNAAAGTYRVVAIHSFASANYFSGGPHLNDKNSGIIEEWLRWTPEIEEEIPPPDEKEQEHDEQENIIPELSLNKKELSLFKNDTETLIVNVNSDDISYDDLIWISNNPLIVTVEDNGTVTAIGEGRTTVKVLTPDGRVETGCEVTVISTTSGRLPGDINGDNKVDVQDVVLITRHILNNAHLDENKLQLADVNNDGTVDVRDVTMIMQFALGLIDIF